MQTKWIKRLTLPVLAMLFIYYASHSSDPATSNLVNTMSEQKQEQTMYSSEDYYAVYALHDSNNLVKTYLKKGEQTDRIEEIFSLLTTNANQLPTNTTSLVSPDAKLNDYKLKNGTLTLDLSSEFLDYTSDDEADLLSSIVWTYTELPDVDKVKFEIDGKAMSNLNGAMSVERGLDRSMGINLEIDTMSLDHTQLVTLYFMTDDSKEGLLVPVTRLISDTIDPITYAVSALIQGPAGENYVSVFDQNTTLLEDPVLKDGLLSLNFSSDLYYNNDQTEVSSTMLKQLVMTLTEVDEVEMVSVSIDGNIKVMDDTSRSIAVPTARTNVESFIEAH